MSRDLDTHTINLLAATHERQVRDTQALYGQRSGIDQPSHDERLPFEGFVEAVGDLVGRVFEIFIVALVLFMVIGLTLSAAPTP